MTSHFAGNIEVCATCPKDLYCPAQQIMGRSRDAQTLEKLVEIMQQSGYFQHITDEQIVSRSEADRWSIVLAKYLDALEKGSPEDILHYYRATLSNEACGIQSAPGVVTIGESKES